jgi:(1->4)-alpha-D-glucan 1-alpha-D-glucosylmutase
MTPSATYRVQFHAGFTFADATPLAPYWAKLGISHLYASPIAVARAGSTHGYDVIDPTRINPALGGEEGFASLVRALRAHGLGIVLDIVPNHLAVGGDDNAWWLDVLEKGQASPFAPMFDIDWAPGDPTLAGKVLAPFLGAPYGEALAAGDLRLDVEPARARLSVMAHGAHRFPLRREDYPEILAAANTGRVRDIDPAALAALYDPGQAQGRARLHALLERQHYRLAWWRTAGDEINWRRFFDITALAGLRMEDPAVFDAVHALPLRLYRQNLIDGLRVDHVDGLADPAGYCRRLRRVLNEAMADRSTDAAPVRPWLVVEKILGPGEALAADWDVDGTTGYEFMNEVSALLHNPAGAEPLAALWNEISGRAAQFPVEAHAARREILTRDFAGQLDAAAATFHRLARSDLATRDLSLAALRRAIVALIAEFSVYRTYGAGGVAPAADAALRAAALERAKAAEPIAGAALDQLGRWLAGDGPGGQADRAEAMRRFQQLSAPVAAKAVEDTAFYRYGRLLSRNDVGFDPDRLATTPAQFVDLATRRAETFPHALLTTATHDHKRGEDVRARLAVLSEIPRPWAKQARAWLSDFPLNGVDPGDAHMIHQMIVGAWPLDLDGDDAAGLSGFCQRLVEWQRKALREAKLRSSWTVPDETYETTCAGYLQRLLIGPDARFRESCARFVDMIAPAGVANSLVQTGLRLTLPGVPDLFQGAEDWDFSLVDPDNRRPIDYTRRIAGLASGQQPDSWRSGQTKQALIARLLAVRAERPALFDAALTPLPVHGHRADQVLAFERVAGQARLTVVCALRCAASCVARGAPFVSEDWWGNTALADDQPLGALTGGAPFWWTAR